MKVYEFKAFPNPYRVRVALAEKGLTGFLYADFCQIEIPRDAIHLRAWRDRVNARPSASA